jgi:hypothetical protein
MTTTITIATGAAAIALAAELSALSDLKEWPELERRVERVLEALGGGQGVDAREVRELRDAAARWRRLRPDVRRFYVDNHGDETVSIVLWHLLFRPIPDILTGPRIGRLRQLWADQFGSEPRVEIYPRKR